MKFCARNGFLKYHVRTLSKLRIQKCAIYTLSKKINEVGLLEILDLVTLLRPIWIIPVLSLLQYLYGLGIMLEIVKKNKLLQPKNYLLKMKTV